MRLVIMDGQDQANFIAAISKYTETSCAWAQART